MKLLQRLRRWFTGRYDPPTEPGEITHIIVLTPEQAAEIRRIIAARQAPPPALIELLREAEKDIE